MRIYCLITISTIILVYSIFFIDKDLFKKLNLEDGLFENFTALFFLFTSGTFFIIFLRNKKMINILFFLVFFFGFGEEISWGQRILNFKTPDTMSIQNRQGEFTMHNLEFSTPSDTKGHPKNLFRRYLNFGALFLLFCLTYTLIYPILYKRFLFIRKFGDAVGLQIPPTIFGWMFILNYLITKILLNFFSGGDYRCRECEELIMAFIFSLMSLYFYKSLISVKIPGKN